MNSAKLLLTAISILTISTISNANTMSTVIAYVDEVGTYEDGNSFIFFDRKISSCSDSKRLDINTTKATGHEKIISIALVAFTSKSAVKIHPGSCDGSSAVFGAEGDSYIYLTNETPN